MDTETQELLRAIPKVDELLAALSDHPGLTERPPRPLLLAAVRNRLERLRRGILEETVRDHASLACEALIPLILADLDELLRPRLQRVINATGVIVHTNLGRSLLPPEAMEAIQRAGAHYSNLEFDLKSGRRGSRYSLVEELLCQLTGAEAALVVNNNAAAVLITLQTLAAGREVIVSRGQLVEIGGSFRIPDVMAASGAVLREVGATNRTHLRDYEGAINERTALLMKVHNSNYRIIGFHSEVGMEELVALGARRGLPVVEDLGSGCLVDLSRFGLMKEPTVREVVAAGVDVVTFSGDKLLGGPQAGIIIGRRDYIERIKKNPMNRAMRIDKFTLAGLEAVLRFYHEDDTALARIPTLRMIAAPAGETRRRARRLMRRLRPGLNDDCAISLVELRSRVGGGAMPEQDLRGYGVRIEPHRLRPSAVEQALRRQDPAVVLRVEHEGLVLDMRTVADSEVPLLASALTQALTRQAP